MYDVIIIGAGVTGSLIARALSLYQVHVLLLEKENDVGNVTSMANSAIVHSGYDPVPGSNKARFNVAGNKMYDELCQKLDVNFGRIGSLTLVSTDEQWLLLRQLKDRAAENGVPVELLSAEDVRKMEPNVNPNIKGGLLAPTAGIVNPFQLVTHAAENAVDNGVELHLDEKVIDISEKDNIYTIKTNKAIYASKIVINSAGLHADEIARMIGDKSFTIHARKGEYYVLDHFGYGFVNHVIFPLPSEKGKGILFTPTTSGNYLVGPSSQFVDEKDVFATDALTLAEVRNSATILVPSIPFNQTIRTFSGLRSTPDTHDFVIKEADGHPGFIIVGGIESPGLASSPAIAEYVVEKLVRAHLSLSKNPQAHDYITPYTHPQQMNFADRQKLIANQPEFGDIICNCEKISRGEILETLRRSCPPHSIKGVKKRTRAGFGRCQGGFCQTKVIALLADYYHVAPNEINYDGEHTSVLLADSKKEHL